MYSQDDPFVGLDGLGFGVSAKVKFPKEIREAAASFPAFRVETGRLATAFDKTQAYTPWLFIGGAALVVFLVLVKGADQVSKAGK
jgi:hypothetical protein